MSANLDRVDARAKLKARRDPYWQKVAQGRHIGFRRMARGADGTWLARLYDGEKYQYKPLGDFASLPEKERFDAAKREADGWFKHLEMGGTAQSSTVKEACAAYVEKLRLEKSEAAANDAKGRFARLVDGDPLGSVSLAKLAPRHLVEWKKRALAKGGTRGSFNRNATALRAALNLSKSRREVTSDHAWSEELKPFENADGRRELYLKRNEREKLSAEASPEAQRFVRVLRLLPLRPGDVAKLTVADFSSQHKTLSVPTGKTGARVIPLSDDAVAHFKKCAKGKLPGAWLIARDDGQQWKKEAWRDEIKVAAVAAKLPLATCAYALRHAAITDMVTAGFDLFTVAKLSGTSVKMIEKNYGHLQHEHAKNALEALARAR